MTPEPNAPSETEAGAFRDLPSMIARHAKARPAARAVVEGDRSIDYAGFDTLIDRVAAALQREGLGPGDCVAICAASSIEYVAVFIGALRAGLAAAPLAPGSTPSQLAAMASDCGAALIFIDDSVARLQVPWPVQAPVLRLDGGGGQGTLQEWLAAPGARPLAVAIDPAWPFNLIYSSGTTGTPKGIVQPHAMRWAHVQRAVLAGYAPDAITLVATPLYSNTTLVAVVPTLAYGGCLVLMAKFDALAYLQLAVQAEQR